MSAEVSVAIVDDHDVIHAGVQAWCAEADPPIKIVGNYFSAEQFLAEHPEGTNDLDIVLLDLELQSRCLDFSLLERIAPYHRVIVYSHIGTDEVILHCLDLGAITYLVKSEGKDHLMDAIHAARSDTPYVGPRMAGAMFNDRNVGRPSLARREQEVLIAWFQTESKDLVAKKLFIAPTTVRTHLQRVRAKYASVGRPAPTKAALVARAIQDGIINLDDM
ncbi:MAG: two component transcriptional regulator, LuxR family [Mycobacterium sp.]|nr:two component transcriptional regulator, LuxR family [Mycobacterium sp.]